MRRVDTTARARTHTTIDSCVLSRRAHGDAFIHPSARNDLVDRRPVGRQPVIAFDAVDAGVGDRVLLTTEGFSAMTSVGRPNSPIDMSVIGVIDRIDLFEGLAGQAPAAGAS